MGAGSGFGSSGSNMATNFKTSVRAATTANITLSGTQTVDGVALIAGDRILVKNQSTGSENGIYVVAAGAWSRSTDADAGAELLQAVIPIEEGTVNADTVWVCTTNAPIVIGVSSISFSQTSAITYTAGTGLQLIGNQFSIDSTVATLSGSQALTNKTYNGNTITSGSGTLTLSTFTLTVGGTSSISGASSGTNTGDQTITLTGEASGSGTGSFAVTLLNASVIGKVLTGYVSGAGVVAATDTILQSIQKLNGNIGALVTGVSSVSGTANRITSTGGATPVIDISASYVGQSSITTLGTITTGVWNGTAIANANLANSSLTIGSTNISLGATSTTLAGLTSVTSTTFVGALTGNASTATALQNARTINGTSFDGTANITVTAAAGTLTGTTLNATVVTSSLTSVGTIATGVWNGTKIGVAYGGTNLTTVAAGSVIAANTVDVVAAITSTSGNKGLINDAGVISWAAVTGTGAPVRDTSPTFTGTPVLATPTATSIIVTGTAGNGFLDLQTQSSAPSVGATNSVRVYSNVGALAWLRESDGFVRSLASTLTANRTYTLPDANLTITGGGTFAMGGFTLTVPATGTATLGSPGASGNVFVGTSSTTGAGTSSLTYVSPVFTNSVSTNAAVVITASNANAGAAAIGSLRASNGTTISRLDHLGTSYTTAGLLVAGLSNLTTSSAAGMLISATAASTKIWFSIGGTAASNEIMQLSSAGVAINGAASSKLSVATAYLHLAAGVGGATANTAPLKFTSGTNLTTAETGAIEYNGTNLFFTRTGTTRESVFVGNDAAAAPATAAIGVILDYYGTSATRVLTTPNSWASVVVAGTTYKIPLYT